MQSKLGLMFSLQHFFIPNSNHWIKRVVLVFAFIIFDYLSTLAFCNSPSKKANLYARMFMENLGIPLGLTLFVFVANMPIYVSLSLDSHVAKFPSKIAATIEILVDVMFAWFIAGMHFSGGSSWFCYVPTLHCHIIGASMYLMIAFLFVKPHKPQCDS